jgi:prolyl-tRNA synthetase
MKPVDVAQAKSDKLYQEFFDALKIETNKMMGQSNMTGGLYSSGVDAMLREMCLGKMKALECRMVTIYVEALGYGLDQAATKTAISQKLGAFFEECRKIYFGPESRRPANEQNVDVFEREAEQLIHQLNQDLQIAVHEARRAVPSFWKNKKHEILLAIIAFALGIAGTLIAQWLIHKFNMQGP